MALCGVSAWATWLKSMSLGLTIIVHGVKGGGGSPPPPPPPLIILAILVKFRLLLKGRKIIKLSECEQVIYHFKARDMEIPKLETF